MTARHASRSNGSQTAKTTEQPCVFEALEDRLLLSSSMLQVVGNTLVDTGGQTVQLEGVNVISLEFDEEAWNISGDHVPQAVTEALANWNSNTIRLPVKAARWFGSNATTYRNVVDSVISQVNAADGYVILDLHHYGQPTDSATDFWADAANRYQNNPTVLFGLLNEPHGISWDLWRDGDADHPGMQDLLDTVRAQGANNVVTASGVDWGFSLSGVLSGYALDDPTGNGVVYETHVYPWKGGWDINFGNVSDLHPVLVGEFGHPGTTYMPYVASGFEEAATWVPKMLDYIDEHNLNYTGWCLYPGDTPPSLPSLITDWNFTPTSYWGQPFLDWTNTPSSTLFQDDFQGLLTPSEPSSNLWDVNVGSLPTSNADTPFGLSTNYLNISGSGKVLLSENLSIGDSLTTYSFDFVDSTPLGTDDGMVVGWATSTASDLDTAANTAIAFKLSQGSIVGHAGSTVSGSAGYLPGIKHRLDLVFNPAATSVSDYYGTRDLAANQADVYIDGIYAATITAPAASASNAPAKAGFRTFSGDTMADFLIDNVAVEDGVDIAPAALFEDDFEGVTPPAEPSSSLWTTNYGTMPTSDAGTPFGSPTTYLTIAGTSKQLLSRKLNSGDCVTTYSFDFIDNTPTGSDDGMFVAWTPASSNDIGTSSLAFKMRQGQIVAKSGCTTITGPATYSLGEAHHLDLVYNPSNTYTMTDYFDSRTLGPDQADIYIDDVYVATLTASSTAGAYVPARVAFRTYSSDGTTDFMIDNTIIRNGVALATEDQPAETTTVQLAATADAYVRAGSYGDTNYGTSSSLVIKDDSGDDWDRSSFVKFDLSSISGTVTEAVLELQLTTLSNGPAPIEVYAISDDSWSEGGITWNTMPTAGSLVTTASASATGLVSIDVTDYVASQAGGDGVVTFFLTDTSQAKAYAVFGSRESATPPQLSVTSTTGTVPPPIGSSTVELAATADAYVRAGSYANSNYGTSSSLVIKDDSGDDWDRSSFVKFDLSSIAGTVTEAILELELTTLSNGPAPIEVYAISDDSWTEGGITWSTMPTAGSLVTTASASATGLVSIDVTDYVASQAAGVGVVTFFLTDTSQAKAYAVFGSRESATPPQLTVTSTTGTPVETLNFNDYTITSYDTSQDISGVATVLDGGDTLQITGNGWKKIDIGGYTITANTVLEFDFKSTSQGEIHGLGFDNDNSLSTNRFFQLHGTQTDAQTIKDYNNYSGSDWTHYTISVGDYFTGLMDYLTFGNDDDGDGSGISLFRNLMIYEA